MTHWTIGCCLVSLSVFGNLSGPALGNDQGIDTFQYADASAAQERHMSDTMSLAPCETSVH